tara:strand:- start:2139 stop:2315 length:177 start_codon:yes stop_codon:yes gene_type:complete
MVSTPLKVDSNGPTKYVHFLDVNTTPGCNHDKLTDEAYPATPPVDKGDNALANLWYAI